MATPQATKRLTREYASIQKSPPPYITAHPSEANILEWHYILTGPPATPYLNGQYWGTLTFPPDYPFAPPAIRMHTPSGRFQPSARLCLSISDFHPKSFNPAWEVSTILVGLLSFMTGDEMTTGSVRAAEPERRAFAARSRWWNSTGAGSALRAIPGVPNSLPHAGGAAPPPPPPPQGAGARGVAAIKAGDAGARFRREWPELDEENWRWMRERRIDVATGYVVPEASSSAAAAATQQQQQQGQQVQGACAPEAMALRRRPAGSSNAGLGAVVGEGRVARDAGQGWLGRNKWYVGFAALFGYVLLARLLASGTLSGA